ncbi:MAG: TrkH family potassium uptake protein [Deltaproteobacteria bacterium]|nr:TrkH family potassium uptake protein [Deltaproteobacteria bacterium]
MNLRLEIRILSGLLALLGLFQLVPIAAAIYFHEPFWPFLSVGLGGILVGLPVAWFCKTEDRRIRPRDGFLVVSLAWILASLYGALPYLTTGALGPVDAIFESVSGFSTTGSTVFTAIEDQTHALLLWRSLTQWLGGMGIILFTIAILPLLGIGGMQLFKAEVPGPVADKVSPRVAATARRLWLIYVGFTAAEWLALRLAGMSGFDALCHSFTTAASGGFSTKSASIGAFESSLIEWIVIFFMLMAGINFVLHYRLLTGRIRSVWEDAELRYFLAVIGVVAFLFMFVVPRVPGMDASIGLRESLFTTLTILTTTGYTTTNFEAWPSLAQMIILHLMILGGMSGSTSGGVKSLRALLGFRALRASFARLIHPHVVRPVKYGGKPVDDNVIGAIWSFFTAYVFIGTFCAAVVAFAGYDLVTSISASLSALSNIGPGLGDIGPTDNFAHFPGYVKFTLCFGMIAGRLEIFTLLVLFQPEFWRR